MKDRVLEFIYQYKKIILIGFILLSISLGIYLMIPKENNTPSYNQDESRVNLILFGDTFITLEMGDEYIEPGYYAYLENGVIKTSEVIVSGSVNSSQVGTYTITYSINKEIRQRKIQVIEKDNDGNFEEKPKGVITFTLKGSNNISLYKDETYQEPGYTAIDTIDGNITNQVIVTGSVNTSKAGVYLITYDIKNSTGKTKRLQRTVTVIDDSISLSITLDKKEYTNSNVGAKVVVSGNSFSYLLLPNQTKVLTKITSYAIKENGTYTFIAYSESGKSVSQTIKVSNIDKIKPSGTCVATINPDNTKIVVSSTDNLSGIENYIYYDNLKQISSTSNSTYTYPAKTSKQVQVRITDKALNFNQITCQIIDNSYYKPIAPISSENVVYQDETDTLKVYITKKSNYYLTRVWALDPYSQLNKYDSPEYGSNLYRPKALLEKAMSEKNLEEKLLVGFNASGFYLKDTYDSSSVSKYSKYNKTSVGTIVITNGKLIRNTYDKAYKTWFIAGVDRNNQLRLFEDKKAETNNEINEKKIWANSVINSGIRNTFTFASPLIINGKASDITTSMPSVSSKVKRQAICQINDNNFVFITGNELSRTNLIDIMLDLNCQTATNLDGGGSIALLFKSKDSQKITTVTGNNRSLTEVLYFTE